MPLDTRKVNLRSLPSRPPTVDEFLSINPLPAQLRHLEPSLRKLPHAGLLIQILLGCLEYDMGNADFDRIIHTVGDIYNAERQRCAACFCWTSQFHVILAGTPDRYTIVPMCDRCMTKFETGRQSPQMERNLNAYAGEVATK